MWYCHTDLAQGYCDYGFIQIIAETLRVTYCPLKISLVRRLNTDFFTPFISVISAFGLCMRTFSFTFLVLCILTYFTGLSTGEDPGLMAWVGECAVNVFQIKYLKVTDMRTVKYAVPVFIGLMVLKIARYRGFPDPATDECHVAAVLIAAVPVLSKAFFAPVSELRHACSSYPCFVEAFPSQRALSSG